MSSSTKLGTLTRRLGLFLTPEESNPPKIISLLHENLAKLGREHEERFAGDQAEISDPGVCALHFALLPNRAVKKRHRYELRALVYRLIEDGADSLSPVEKRTLISDPETVMRLHTLSWSREQDAVDSRKL